MSHLCHTHFALLLWGVTTPLDPVNISGAACAKTRGE